ASPQSLTPGPCRASPQSLTPGPCRASPQPPTPSPCIPDGYNLGLNVGAAAGQTVPRWPGMAECRERRRGKSGHLHLHLIPRFDGDVDDPTGGVRFVIPERGNYRRGGFLPTAREHAGSRARPLAAGGPGDPFLAHLVPLFARADDISILAAFVQDSGVQRLEPYLLSALERGARVRLLTGDNLNITRAHALRRVLDLGRGAAAEGEASGTLELRVVRAFGAWWERAAAVDGFVTHRLARTAPEGRA
ncbi:MAG: hypothetical protein ACYDA8_15190, partial [Deferrisomatales bacterium]